VTVAALYVEKGGVYYGLEGVDPWDEERDARKYAGPWPVVAHPPCERWGAFWSGGPLAVKQGRRRALGDDGGCFAAALAAVQRWGGVLEHPAHTRAWAAFGLSPPPASGTLSNGKQFWSTEINQGHYGHLATKATWLYVVGSPPVQMHRGPCNPTHVIGRRRWREDTRPEVPKRQRKVTPLAFRDLLLALARSSNPKDPTP
jgi:hypothetical protein